MTTGTIKNITRVQSATIKGHWWVRFYKRDSKHTPTLQARFYDHDYGGSGNALRAAIKWRDEHAEQFRDIRPGREPSLQTGWNTTTGVSGISIIRREGRAPQWQVTWSGPPGAKSSKSFSMKKWGYRGGWRLALRMRAKMLGKATPRTSPPEPPDWLIEWAKENDPSMLDR